MSETGTYNYRIKKWENSGHTWYGVCEVYYNDKGQPTDASEPKFAFESVDLLLDAIDIMTHDIRANKDHVLSDDDFTGREE